MSSLKHRQMRKDLAASRNDVAGLLQIGKYDGGFDLRVGVGVLGVVSGATHAWHRTKERTQRLANSVPQIRVGGLPAT